MLTEIGRVALYVIGDGRARPLVLEARSKETAVTNFNLVVLYVKDSDASAAFYQTLLDRPIAQSSPKFSMLPLDGGAMLGLWQREAVEPPASHEPGGSEISFSVADPDAVRATHETWKARGATIAQAPTALPFGLTFVALDPDGHRLRVLAPPQ